LNRWIAVTAPVLEAPAYSEPSRSPPQPRRHSRDELAQDQRDQRRVERHPRSQRVRHRQHPLPDRHPWEYAPHRPRGEVRHAPPDTARAEAAPLARPRHRTRGAAVLAPGENEAVRKDPAPQVGLDLGHDEGRQGRVFGSRRQVGQERLPLALHRPEQHGRLGPVPLVFAPGCRP
jgi:hypothetical protein